jgi:cytochrome d ubiquinol oxidase subunit II
MVTPLWLALAALTAVSLAATIIVRPASLNNYFNYPATFIVPVGVIASMAGIWLLNRNAQPVKAFLSSCLYLFFMLAGACWGLYPTLLPATTGADRDITLSRAISGPHTLAVGLIWWGFGMVLAIGYIVFVYAKFRGKVDMHADGHRALGTTRLSDETEIQPLPQLQMLSLCPCSSRNASIDLLQSGELTSRYFVLQELY